MAARWVGFLVWVAAGASLVSWSFRLLAPSLPPPPQARVVAAPGAVSADHTPMLGAQAGAARPEAVTPVSSVDAPRLTLVGVVAAAPGSPAREALALIAVDDSPARAYRVGHRVGEGLVLQSVSSRGVRLGPRGAEAAVELELPALPAAAPSALPGALPPSAGSVRAGTAVAQPAPAGAAPAAPLAPAAAGPAAAPGGPIRTP